MMFSSLLIKLKMYAFGVKCTCLCMRRFWNWHRGVSESSLSPLHPRASHHGHQHEFLSGDFSVASANLPWKLSSPPRVIWGLLSQYRWEPGLTRHQGPSWLTLRDPLSSGRGMQRYTCHRPGSRNTFLHPGHLPSLGNGMETPSNLGWINL